MAEHTAVDSLQTLIEHAPDTLIETHIDSGLVTAGSLQIDAALPAALRDAFISGEWNPAALLLDGLATVRTVAGRLPYIAGF